MPFVRPVHSRLTLLSVSFATLVGAMFVAIPARAESWLLDGTFGAASGLEAGDPGSGSLEWRRARLRLIAGVDLRADEDETQGFGFRGFTEIEQRASLGAEVRYWRWTSRNFGAYGGFTGTLVPETLLGVGVGAKFLIPMGRAGLFLEPSLSALPFGTDLPKDTMLIWTLMTVGVHVSL